ncbi:hypothetical protein LUZ60_003960 [Juncus effusus]|nr:hypothetical protein LUZ60_003960 [Juncus effusus]
MALKCLWIVKLSKIQIEDLTLDLSWRYEIHSSLFSFDALSNLNLKCCLVKLPDQFKGFKLVQTLTLESLEISGDNLEKLVSSCPLLKKLGIHYLPRHIILNVHAKNLESLQIAGKCSDIHIHAPKLESLEFIWCTYSYLELNAPKLRSIKINARGCESRRDERNFGRFLDNVPDLEYLELGGAFLEYLSSASWLKESQLIFNRLKYVKLELFYLMETDVPFVLSLLQRAPLLELLDIKV